MTELHITIYRTSTDNYAHSCFIPLEEGQLKPNVCYLDETVRTYADWQNIKIEEVSCLKDAEFVANVRCTYDYQRSPSARLERRLMGSETLFYALVE